MTEPISDEELVKRWLKEGCPSWGAPIDSIRRQSQEIERLRAIEKTARDFLEEWHEDHDDDAASCPLCQLAAALELGAKEIERLRSENERLTHRGSQ